MTIIHYDIYLWNTICSNYPNRITLILREVLLKNQNNKQIVGSKYLIMFIENKI